jgi:DNA-binding MarR family transcriptional regulator
MQQLQGQTDSRASCQRCARGLLTGVPSVLRFIRYQMRRHRQAELTVPQFRALVFLNHNEYASLSDMAEDLGLSLPAASRMVELLVKRGWMRRRARSSDRRCVSLSLTGRGKAVFRMARKATQVALSQRLKSLSAGELALVSGAMQVLSRAFAPENCQQEAVK